MQAVSATYTTVHGNAGSSTHRARPGIEPATSWLLDRFVSTGPQQELLKCFLMNVLLGICRHWLCFHCAFSFTVSASALPSQSRKHASKVRLYYMLHPRDGGCPAKRLRSENVSIWHHALSLDSFFCLLRTLQV